MNKNAGIVIPTKNRSDFIIRQLKYYASVKCHHAIYIGDSSNEEYKAKTENAIKALGNKIKIVYKHVPAFNNGEAIHHLLSIVEEPYACFIGDDDYQIPNSITKCIEFLENNPNYATASGYAVSFRLKNNLIYGELGRIANYPRPYVEAETARERVVKYFENYYVPLFSVNRTSQMLKNWENVGKIKDESFGAEIIPSALSIIAGKSMTIDCLGFIRQIHNRHFPMPNTFDWLTTDDWLISFRQFFDILSSAISSIDNIPAKEAQFYVKQGLWIYIEKQLTREYSQIFSQKNILDNRTDGIKKIRSLISRNFPLLKKVYKKWVKKQNNIKDLHFNVTQESSKYYVDFKPIMDSLSGKIKI